MDLDVFVSAHRAEWDRLDALLRRRRRLTGAEADELVALYQRAATNLSLIQSSAPDPQLTGRLSQLVARARSAVTGTRRASWRDVTRFLLYGFPAAVYRARHWWVPTALVSTVVAVLLGWWIAAHPEVQSTIGAPGELRNLTRPGGEYETYYSSHPAAAFAAQVWTNNAQAAAMCLVLGVFLLPVLWILFENMLNLAVGIGLMSSAGRLDTFVGLILPHGLLELTAVFVAAGTGLRLGWTLVDPGPRPRRTALAEEGRAAVGMAIGLALVLFVSGAIEGFVTPSGLPTWARIGIGVAAELLFLAYVYVLGGRAARGGETGDVEAAERSATVPTAA
ncbi:stage II sporulation protein M [Streptomyces sp. NPDC014864]|uniref:stage II sporulation protein M n=1 Tax=Streptomyces sp. NPDC014864 TaxID=3364924 RepID=UPI0036FC21DC